MTATAPVAVDRWAELRFRAMGTSVHVAVLGDDPSLLMDAQHRVEDLERRWSRFLPTSALSRLNRSEGRPVAVDDDTFALVAAAVDAWRRTGQRFDPTVLDALVAEGYDRPFDELDNDVAGSSGGGGRPTPGCRGIELEPRLGLITLPPGTHLDLGGIGKGRAADLVALELVTAGARSALVNLGGDLRTAGEPSEVGFSIDIEDPVALERRATTVILRTGALATSSRTRRRWTVAGEERHHLIDPLTGRPATSTLAAVTVLAETAMEAEVLAKATLLAGTEAGIVLLAEAGAAALLIAGDGTRIRTGPVEEQA